MPVIARLRRLALILIACSGWRPESRSVAWPVAFALSLALATWVGARGDPTITLVYFGVAWSFFYVGNTVLLVGRTRERPPDDEPSRAWSRYQIVVGLMFANQGLALGAVCALGDTWWALPLSEHARLAIGLPLVVVGLVVKVWAADLVGIDTFYFKDLFTGRPMGELVQRGPYRLFANPMYGPGYAHAYGLALLAGSWIALAAAALCQLGIYGFYLIAERPFVRRVYRPAAMTRAATPVATIVRETP